MSSSLDATLLVLDGADRSKTLRANTTSTCVGSSRARLADVIITSRSRTTLGLSSFEGVQVRELEVSQAVELFRKAANLKEDDAPVDSQVRAIVEELGYLALAVSLAGTYTPWGGKCSSIGGSESRGRPDGEGRIYIPIRRSRGIDGVVGARYGRTIR